MVRTIATSQYVVRRRGGKSKRRGVLNGWVSPTMGMKAKLVAVNRQMNKE